MNIIGLGSLGCSIAMKISAFNEEAYNTYLVDTKKYKKFKSKKIENQATPEMFEEKYKSLKRFFVNLSAETLLILSGKDLITSSCLRMIEEIRGKTNIQVLYLKPEVDMLSKNIRMHEKVIRSILQEYARSTLLERMYLVSLEEVSNIMGPTTLNKRLAGLTEMISYYFHMINFYDNSEPVMSSESHHVAPARISTLGVFDVASKEEKMFFDLAFPREIVYYYGVSKEKLETDVDLYSSIREHIKGADFESVAYRIFQLTSGVECGIVLKHASYIQG